MHEPTFSTQFPSTDRIELLGAVGILVGHGYKGSAAALQRLLEQAQEKQEAAAELDALRNVYEQARGVLRHDGIDKERAIQYRDGLVEAIETVKVIDGGNWEPPVVAQVPHGSYVSTSGELKPDVSVYDTPTADATVAPKWIDDPHDIEQGQMLNPEWVKEQEAAVTVFLPFSARTAIAKRHGMKVTAEFNALVRDVVAEYRARAVPSDIAAAAQVVLPDPDGFLESHPFGSIYHRGKPSQIQMICGACPPMYEAGTVRALLATGGQAQAFQQRVQPWMMACFGPEISADVAERNHRFLEEALELVQACGRTASEAHQLVDYVFGRPVGDKQQEVGGVMVTLAALCLAQGLDMHAAGEVELARIWTKVEAIRAKQAAKPKHSPLPEHAPQAQADARDAESDYQRGYRHGYNRRDAEVQGALL